MLLPRKVKNILIEILEEGNHFENGIGSEPTQLPPASTPIHKVFPDSMAILTALLALEEKTGGDLTLIGSDAPPPQTFGDFISLGSTMNPSFFQEEKE